MPIFIISKKAVQAQDTITAAQLEGKQIGREKKKEKLKAKKLAGKKRN